MRKYLCLFVCMAISLVLLAGCSNGKNYESARKPHIMYNDNLYGLSAHLPKSHPYETIGYKLKKAGVVEGNVSISQLPDKNFQTNDKGYAGAEIYTDAEGNMQTVYIRINKDLEDDKFIRFDLNSDKAYK